MVECFRETDICEAKCKTIVIKIVKVYTQTTDYDDEVIKKLWRVQRYPTSRRKRPSEYHSDGWLL